METTCEDLGNLVLLTFWGRRLDVASKADFTAAARELVRPDRRRELPPPSFAAPLKTEYWDDDGSEEFKTMKERIGREGPVIES